MIQLRTHFLIVFASLFFFTSCTPYVGSNVGTAQIIRAQEEIPEDQLLDVGVLVFTSENISEYKADQEGTSNEIRKAETHFIPNHLKNTLHQSGHWGAVRVIPAETNGVDLQIKGEILKSNGQRLTLKIEAVDATGKTWFTKTYKGGARDSNYTGNQPGERDAFQYTYNTIANDLVTFKMKLTPEEIRKIRTTAKLKYAAEFAPDAFSGYLEKDEKNNVVSIKRLPADGDPMMERVLKIREREYMYVDTLNEQYDEFYNEMWPSYEDWRKYDMTERNALHEIKMRALTNQVIGALLIGGAIASGSPRSGTQFAMQAGMILVGGQVIMNGFNVSKEAEMHKAGLRELSQSFSNEVKPVVMELEGKQYELTGTAEEQFKQWRELMRKIYFAETGFQSDLPMEKPAAKQYKRPPR